MSSLSLSGALSGVLEKQLCVIYREKGLGKCICIPTYNGSLGYWLPSPSCTILARQV